MIWMHFMNKSYLMLMFIIFGKGGPCSHLELKACWDCHRQSFSKWKSLQLFSSSIINHDQPCFITDQGVSKHYNGGQIDADVCAPVNQYVQHTCLWQQFEGWQQCVHS